MTPNFPEWDEYSKQKKKSVKTPADVSMEEEEAMVSPLTQTIVRARVVSSREGEMVLSKVAGEISGRQHSP